MSGIIVAAVPIVLVVLVVTRVWANTDLSNLDLGRTAR
jgi:hypothetical protein